MINGQREEGDTEKGKRRKGRKGKEGKKNSEGS